MAKIFFGSTEMSPAIKETIYIPKEKFGLTIDNFVGDVDENGYILPPVIADMLVFDGVKHIVPNDFYHFMSYKSLVKNVVFPDLLTISGESALMNSFRENKILETASFPKLQSISGPQPGSGVASYSFRDCVALKKISLDNLETLDAQQCLYYFAYGCKSLQNVIFPKLKTIKGNYAFYYAFQYCTSLQRIDFPALTEIEQDNVFGASSSNESFKSCTSLTEIHFRTDMQSVIEKQLRYSSKFGATNATIYFDL